LPRELIRAHAGDFIAGPLGFILGGVGGLIYWDAKRRKGTGEKVN